ncbi:MAG: hypothetical protein QM750_11840 [Rubrivivax sp.]
MALDPAIYQAFAPKQTSALDTMQSLSALDAQRGDNALRQLQRQMLQGQADDAEHQRGQRNALERMLAGPGFSRSDPDARQRLSQVAPSLAGGVIKEWDDQDKAAADLAETKARTGKLTTETKGLAFDQQVKRRQQHISELAGVYDAPTAVQWINDAAAAGEVPKDRAAQMIADMQSGKLDPMQWRTRAMLAGVSSLDQMRLQRDQQRDAETAANSKRIDERIRSEGAANRSVTMRGQNMVDARAREVDAPRGQFIQTPDGYMLADPRTGTVRPVTGPDGKPLQGASAGKPLLPAALKQITEARDNASTMGALSSSFKDDYGGKGLFGLGADAQLNASGVMGLDPDAVEWWKRYRKQSELVERHSLFGAALTPHEQESWRGADISPGLNPKTIKRNLTTRAELAKKVLATTQQDLIDAGHDAGRINAIAGRQGAAETALGASAPPRSPGIGAVEDGHRFKGGDPSNPANWEKL